MTVASPRPGYLPKLDGIRAISIFLVLVEHFFSSSHRIGGLGVTIFFVISGYLITGILLRYSEQFSTARAARVFYWRRLIRLFPAYYLCIAVTAALSIGDMRRYWLINLFYLMNFKVALEGTWNACSHFWSLAVEEQFYLIWFFVIVLVRRRYVVPVILSAIVIAPIWRGVAFAVTGDSLVNVLLPGVMDSLATGALLCCLNQSSLTRRSSLISKYRTPALLIAGVLMVLLMVRGETNMIGNIFLRPAWNLFSFCLVSIGIDSRKNRWFDWLSITPLRHIDKISYGIYVYHYFVPQFLRLHAFSWVYQLWPGRIGKFLVLSALSCLVADLSWRCIERPISKFKELVH